MNRLATFPVQAERGPPGVYVEDVRPAPPAAAAFRSGVPAFVGFAAIEPQARHTPSVFSVDRLGAGDVARRLAPREGGFLTKAVAGFFANGGEECLVVAVPPETGVRGVEAALAPGGVLDDRSDFDLVCLPDAFTSARDAPPARIEQAIEEAARAGAAALAHCALRGDRFAILDAPPFGAEDGPLRLDGLADYLARLRAGRPVDEDGREPSGGIPPTAYGALYFPWIVLPHRAPAAAWETTSPQWRRRSRFDADAGEMLAPACGHVAGLYARTDARVGAFRSPANLPLDGLVDVSLTLAESELATLNRAGVNGLSGLGRTAIEVVGARTLSGRKTWGYVAGVRVVAGFRRWLSAGLRDMAFEPHTPDLWERIRLRLVARCEALMRAGALAGERPADAFFVKCDAETNTADEAAAGRVVAYVGLAPAVPAEFIVVRVEHQEAADGAGSL